MNIYKFKDMKRGVVMFLIVLMLPAIRLTAQNPNLEKLNAYKIAFFTRRLNLSSQEAEKFWPVYNEFQRQKNQIQLEKSSIIRNFNQNESNLSDDQLTQLGDKLVGTIVQESSLAITFHNKLKMVLPPAKVIRLYQVENQYKAQLLNELQGINQRPRGNLRRDL
jgi:hypothetical protein